MNFLLRDIFLHHDRFSILHGGFLLLGLVYGLVVDFYIFNAGLPFLVLCLHRE